MTLTIGLNGVLLGRTPVHTSPTTAVQTPFIRRSDQPFIPAVYRESRSMLRDGCGNRRLSRRHVETAIHTNTDGSFVLMALTRCLRALSTAQAAVSMDTRPYPRPGHLPKAAAFPLRHSPSTPLSAPTSLYTPAHMGLWT